MANAGQFAQDADILLRLGNNAHTTVKGAGWFDTIILDCEAMINAITRFDWSTVDAAKTLNTSIRGILIDAGACWAAILGLTWSMSSNTSRLEAEDIINVLRDRLLFNVGILKSKKVQTFMRNA